MQTSPWLYNYSYADVLVAYDKAHLTRFILLEYIRLLELRQQKSTRTVSKNSSCLTTAVLPRGIGESTSSRSDVVATVFRLISNTYLVHHSRAPYSKS
jgi:hypothetical protein